MILAEPVSQPSSLRHSFRRSGPAARWIACSHHLHQHHHPVKRDLWERTYTIHAPTTEQTLVRSIDDAVNLQLGDVTPYQRDLGIVCVVHFVRGRLVRCQSLEFVEEGEGGYLVEGDEGRHSRCVLGRTEEAKMSKVR